MSAAPPPVSSPTRGPPAVSVMAWTSVPQLLAQDGVDRRAVGLAAADAHDSPDQAPDGALVAGDEVGRRLRLCGQRLVDPGLQLCRVADLGDAVGVDPRVDNLG